MSCPDLTRLAELARAASHLSLGTVRWFRIGQSVYWSPVIDGRDTCVPQSYADFFREVDAEFAAAASPDVVLGLLDELERVKAERDAVAEDYARIHDAEYPARRDLRLARAELERVKAGLRAACRIASALNDGTADPCGAAVDEIAALRKLAGEAP